MRKGFTLLELLVAIIVIGILAVILTLSSTEAATSAKVAAIINNLENLRTAALALWADQQDRIEITVDNLIVNHLFPYMADGRNWTNSRNPEVKKYWFSAQIKERSPWYVTYHITGTAEEKKRIREKLAARAASLGLFSIKGANYYQNNNEGGPTIRSTLSNLFTADDEFDYVALRVR